MKKNLDFFKTRMPSTRKADFYLGCLDSSVYLDFSQSDEGLIFLERISFDSYGCCDIENPASLDYNSSKEFLKEINKEEFNQENLRLLVKKIIEINKNHIWLDALERYDLL